MITKYDKQNYDPIVQSKMDYLLEHFDHKCCYCGTKVVYGLNATIEHLVRQCDGGVNDIENLAVACEPCNSNRNECPPHIWKDVCTIIISLRKCKKTIIRRKYSTNKRKYGKCKSMYKKHNAYRKQIIRRFAKIEQIVFFIGGLKRLTWYWITVK